MIGRLLCKLGFHKWTYRKPVGHQTYPYVATVTCKRCGGPK